MNIDRIIIRNNFRELESERDTSITTDIIESFSTQNIKRTADAVQVLMRVASNYGISSDHVYIVISSGVVQEAKRQNFKISHLQDAIRQTINEPQREIQVIDVDEEAKLTYLSMVQSFGKLSPKELIDNALSIDIGSGNTKGGFMDSQGVFSPLHIEYGSGSLKMLVDPDYTMSSNDFVTKTDEAMSKIARDELHAQLTPIFPKKYVFLSGGIMWAVITLTRPETVTMQNGFFQITQENVNDFKNKVINDNDRLMNPSLDNIEPKYHGIIKREILAIKKNFPQKKMIAGIAILQKIMNLLNNNNPNKEPKQYVYSKLGYVAWIRAKVPQELLAPKR